MPLESRSLAQLELTARLSDPVWYRGGSPSPPGLPLVFTIEEGPTFFGLNFDEFFDPDTGLIRQSALPAGGAGHVIQENGVPLTDRDNLNFGEGIVASDNDPTTDVDISWALVGAIADVAAVASAGTATTVARADHAHAHGAEAKNLVFAGPSSGADAAPTFRSLVTADLVGAGPFVKLDGSTPLTGDWDVGAFNIKFEDGKGIILGTSDDASIVRNVAGSLILHSGGAGVIHVNDAVGGEFSLEFIGEANFQHASGIHIRALTCSGTSTFTVGTLNAAAGILASEIQLAASGDITMGTTGRIQSDDGLGYFDFFNAGLRIRAVGAMGFQAFESTTSTALIKDDGQGTRIGITAGAGVNVALTGDATVSTSLRVGSATKATVPLDVTGAALISDTLGVTGLLTASADITLDNTDAIITMNDILIERKASGSDRGIKLTHTGAGVYFTMQNDSATRSVFSLEAGVSDHLSVVEGASAGVYYFENALNGENPEIRLYGRPTGSVKNHALFKLEEAGGDNIAHLIIRSNTDVATARIILRPSVFIGNALTNPAATLHVDQTSASGAVPVLLLDQADASEQCIKFSSSGSDIDINLFTVDVTGTPPPTLMWDESEDGFNFSKGLLVLGSFGANIESISSTTTLDATHHVVTCDASGGAFTVTLPAASGITGRIYHIKKTDSSGNAVTVDGNSSETIDDALTQVISTQYDSMMIVCTGSEWFII